MELKLVFLLILMLLVVSSNRTFMELKFVFLADEYEALSSSNRTFMELKFVMQVSVSQSLYVLIVPLWNWNMALSLTYFVNEGSNRTFMELKYVSCKRKFVKRLSSNRTFMELKFDNIFLDLKTTMF